MRETTAAPPLAWSRAFPGTPAQAREARQFLAAILDESPAAEDAVLCMSELAANAAIHSQSGLPGGQFTVRAEMDGGLLRVEVRDQGGPWTWPPAGDAGHGRGLLIVAGLARAWGREGDSATGWTVWFEMASPPTSTYWEHR
jgi:anti-sigma regulatory factor (Ser/Thr protein kinase)